MRIAPHAIATTLAATLALLVAGTSARAQDASAVASRVARAGDGEVRLQYAARPGVCGDGHGSINFRGDQRWSDDRCEPGPVRVTLDLRAGQVTGVHTVVGGQWPAPDSRTTDLGTVSARDAAAYFFSLAPRLESLEGAERGNRALLPAIIADAGDVAPQLVALVEDGARKFETRASAYFWLGQLDSTPTSLLLDLFARTKDPKLRERGIFVLSQRRDDAATDALLRIARSDPDHHLRGRALFWLAQKDDPRVTKLITDILER